MSSAAAPAGTGSRSVVVFSHRPEVRDAFRTAVGSYPAADVGPVRYLECSTGAEVVAAVDAGGVDLCVLDGEAQPTGGMGIGRQLKHEITDCPPVLVLIARQADRWLAHWSMAEATLTHPVDPLVAPGVVAELLRARAVSPALPGRSG